jgi:hypothetical protein
MLLFARVTALCRAEGVMLYYALRTLVYYQTSRHGISEFIEHA